MAEVIFTSRTAPTGRRLQAALDALSPSSTVVVNWTGAPTEGALNGQSRTNKLHQLEELEAADVLVPAFSPAGGRFPTIPPIPGWIGRTNFHTRGTDFRAGRARRALPDFWVEPLLLSGEKRLHVFRRPKGTYVVIRTAVKVPSEGEETHPWVRSHDNGWRLSYMGGSTEAERRAACRACEALRLDFGAVDLGTFCGQPLVLEVNTCPSLDEGSATLRRYAEEILKHDSP